jgi:hypothetical protein
MRALAAADILRIWETAHRCHPVDRALALLRTAEPGYSRDELAALPLGERDRRLLSLRQLSFGDRLDGCCECPLCGAAVEFDLACSALHCGPHETEERAVKVDDYTLRVRPLDSFDMAAAAGAADVAAARRMLHRCVTTRNAATPWWIRPRCRTPRHGSRRCGVAADPMAESFADLACPAWTLAGRRLASCISVGEVAPAQRLLGICGAGYGARGRHPQHERARRSASLQGNGVSDFPRDSRTQPGEATSARACRSVRAAERRHGGRRAAADDLHERLPAQRLTCLARREVDAAGTGGLAPAPGRGKRQVKRCLHRKRRST